LFNCVVEIDRVEKKEKRRKICLLYAFVIK